MAGASDEAAAEALSSGGFGSYDDKNDDGETTLHHFGKLGRMDMLLWINSKGCTDLINARDDVGGQTPLMFAIEAGQEESARFLVEAGANVAALDNYSGTTFALAKEHMSSAFCEMIKDRVPPDHLE